ncbi:MAG: hypothetical protein J0H31_16880, partial [Alphaproteobacteria bacterium]|nr:hypothetical protein [Alphaproteobacteria bacterium]
GTVVDQANDFVEEAMMVAKHGQRIGKGQIRVFPAWLTGAKRRLHHASVLMSVFAARLAAKRLGKVSRNRFSVVRDLLAPPAAVQPWTRNADALPNIRLCVISNGNIEYSFRGLASGCAIARGKPLRASL